MAHEKVYGFCENKCKVEVAPKTETDALAADIAALEGVSNGGAIKSKSITNSGTITSTGVINANGGVKGNVTGNVTGKINVSSLTTNSNNIKLATVTAPAASITTTSTSLTKSITLSAASITRYNTSFINVTSSDSTLKGSTTWTLSVSHDKDARQTVTLTVKQGSTTILNTSFELARGNVTVNKTFTRDFTKTYTVSITCEYPDTTLSSASYSKTYYA